MSSTAPRLAPAEYLHDLARVASGEPLPLSADWDVLNTVISYGLAPPPTVTGISPASGPAGGPVTVSGSGFTAAAAVRFGNTVASFSPGSPDPDTELFATVPAGSGTVDVTVTTPTGTSLAVDQDKFTYLAVTGVEPPSGLAGAQVAVYGSGFTAATAVHFGANPGTILSPTNNDSQIVVSVPARSGTVDVTVTTWAGTSLPATSDKFAYLAVSSFRVGPTWGLPQAVFISGNGFVPGTTVIFTPLQGGAPTTETLSSAGETMLVTSAPAPGSYQVTVRTSNGSVTSPEILTVPQLPPGTVVAI